MGVSGGVWVVMGQGGAGYKVQRLTYCILQLSSCYVGGYRLVVQRGYKMAKKQDNRRQTQKPSKKCPKPGRSFNHLQGDEREWAKSNRFDVSERCVHVKGGNRFSGSDDTKLKCGDGRSGFSTRRESQDDVPMEVGLDGQYKKKRTSLIRSKSAKSTSSKKARRIDGSVCRLISAVEITDSQRDPVEMAKREKAYKKLERKKKWIGVNRNKARRAAKRERKNRQVST